jgi:IclR family transcriptional regulator, pca regulon regulatory protein
MPRTKMTAAKDDEARESAWRAPNLRDPRYSQSLERGLAILSCFTAERPTMGIADLADELDMSRSTTHRYVITLVALGYLEQGASRKYRLGMRVTDLGMSVLNSIGLREHSHPLLAELRDRSGYTVSLSILDAVDILYVDRAHSFRPPQSQLELGLHPGSRLPAHCTAMGKLLLANLAESEREELLSQLEPTKRGPNTITGKRALREELERVRMERFATADEELAPDLHAIAAPVRDSTGVVVAAASLSAHTSTISPGELADALGPHLISTADRISFSLGYREDM